MSKLLTLICCYAFATSTLAQSSKKKIIISKATLKDKIKGGWAGQTIGVSFGSYTEFKYNGTFIQDEQTIA